MPHDNLNNIISNIYNINISKVNTEFGALDIYTIFSLCTYVMCKRAKKNDIHVALQLISLTHHQVEIAVIVDGNAYTAVVIHKLFKCYLERKYLLYSIYQIFFKEISEAVTTWYSSLF